MRFSFHLKNDFLGLILTDSSKIEDPKKLIWKLQRKNQFWDDKITVFLPFFVDFTIFSLCNIFKEGWILLEITNRSNYYWFYRSNLLHGGYFALLGRIWNFFQNFSGPRITFWSFFKLKNYTLRWLISTIGI